MWPTCIKKLSPIKYALETGELPHRQNRKVYIYRPNREVEILDNPEAVSGNPKLPGFILRMGKIW